MVRSPASAAAADAKHRERSEPEDQEQVAARLPHQRDDMQVEWTGLHHLFSRASGTGLGAGCDGFPTLRCRTKETTCRESGQGCIIPLVSCPPPPAGRRRGISAASCFAEAAAAERKPRQCGSDQPTHQQKRSKEQRGSRVSVLRLTGGGPGQVGWARDAEGGSSVPNCMRDRTRVSLQPQ